MVTADTLAALALLALTGGLLVWYERRRDFRFDFLAAFLGFYGVLYVFVPAVILVRPGLLASAEANWAETFAQLRDDAVLGAGAVLAFAVVLLGTYETVYVRGRFEGVDDRVRGFAAAVADPDHDLLFVTGVAFLLVGVVSYVLYALSAGGLIEVLTRGQALRSGFTQEGEVAALGVNFSFMKPFLRVAFLAAFVFVGVAPESPLLRRLRLPLLALSLVVSAAALVVYASRTHVVVFASAFIFLRGFGRDVGWPTVRNAALLVPAAVLVIAFLRPILASVAGLEGLGVESLRTVWLEPVVDLSPPFVSLLVALDNVTAASAGWGYWFSRLFFDILPGQLLGLDAVNTVNRHNTRLFGFESQTEEYTYTIAAGVLAYYYYEFYVLGPIIGGAVAGAGLALLDRFRDAVGRPSPYHPLFTYAAMWMIVGLLNGDPANVLKNNIGIFGGLAFVFGVQYLRTWYVRGRSDPIPGG